MVRIYLLLNILAGALSLAPELAAGEFVGTRSETAASSEASQKATETEGAGHDAAVRDAKASRRLERPTSRTPSPSARVISQSQPNKRILTSFAQCDAPTRELDNRNGVGAPLRC